MKPQTVKIWNGKHKDFYKFQKECLEQGREISFCLPCTARNCCVLGYNVTPTSKSWRDLDWDREVMIDYGDYGDYLHVAAQDDLRYRVTSRLNVGDEVSIQDGGMGIISSVRVAGMWGDKWWWRYTARRK